ncbi:hypothetical protein DERP_012975 [Dermatophagoides pteronyssinus]|uniref:Uncharacterized protein n=1 Tax=Dermatophagoides pteronyssinus TaxID=6956 RepID=A0ABQ8ISG5_DERPT|nr:hypothetical protein DERP_012975 [Dermatophagoides pteronyssinus]
MHLVQTIEQFSICEVENFLKNIDHHHPRLMMAVNRMSCFDLITEQECTGNSSSREQRDGRFIDLFIQIFLEKFFLRII